MAANPSILLERERQEEMGYFERSLASAGFLHVAGIDEAGRGPLAGPVVAAAVILPPDCCLPGLRDSKLLDPSERERLFEAIRRSAVSIGAGVIDHEVIDRINILQASLWAMERAVEALAVSPDYLLIDALLLPRISLRQKGIIHGDNLSVSIAAASVVAKVTRDRMMEGYDSQYPVYGFKAHKGYATPEHLFALREYGPSPIHRRSFAGVIDRQLSLWKGR